MKIIIVMQSKIPKEVWWDIQVVKDSRLLSQAKVIATVVILNLSIARVHRKISTEL